MATRQQRLKKVLLDYIKAFEKKQGVVYSFSEPDIPMGVVFFGEWGTPIENVVYDIDNNIPKGVFLDWIKHILEFKHVAYRAYLWERMVSVE